MENVVGETALSFDMKLREKTTLQHHLDFKAHIYSFGSFVWIYYEWFPWLPDTKMLKVDVHTLTAGHRNIWNSCKDKVYLKAVFSVHFLNLILEMVFPSVIFLFLIIYCLINSFWFYFCTRTREIQIFPWGLCTLMVTFTEDWVDSCICAILRYTTHCRCIQDGLIQSKQCWLLYPLQTE